MITLNVHDYCHNCSRFEPKVRNTMIYTGEECCIRETTISCEWHNECAQLYDYIKNEVRKDV